MSHPIARRDFLKVAGGALAYAATDRTFGSAMPQEPQGGGVKISSAAYGPVTDYSIRPKSFTEVRLDDSFWKPRLATNAEVTIPLQVAKLTGVTRGLGGNTLEAAILSLQTHPDPALQARVDAAVRAADSRPVPSNRGFEVAAAYYHATGDRVLIDNAVEAAEALFEDFRLNNPPFSGGERDAINCIQLYRVTGDKKHLDLAKHYLDIRGLPNSVNRSRHNQSYKPVLEQSEAVGHAVNCVSLMVSLLDVGVLTGIRDYADAAQRMWTDAVNRKMYITGGVGSTGNEGFGEPYSLPNISAYSETCAALMFITLNHRMFLRTGDSRYIDVLERSLYNNALSGVSASGDRFFYVNRLASAGDGRDLRWERASLECCPPNLVRFLPQVPGFVYAQDGEDAIYVNLYMAGDTSFRVGNRELSLSVESEMPWGGGSRVAVSAEADIRGTLKLRIPGWARNRPVPGTLYTYRDMVERQSSISVNGRAVNATPDDAGYVSLDRLWTDGDTVEIELPMEVRKVVADDRVRENRRRMAIERGPIVYCAEWPEAEDGHALDLLIDESAQMEPYFDETLFGGVTAIRAQARRLTNPSSPFKPLTLIPYYLWANRGAGEMAVWLSRAEYALGDTGPAGGLIFYDNPNWAADGWRYLEAAPFDQSAGAKWGCFRTAVDGARGTAVGTGKQNTADILRACSEAGSAASLCAAYNLNGIGGWFLPSEDELALMYRNLKAKGHGDFRDAGMVDNCMYWTSSQRSSDMAVHIDFVDNGRPHYDDKDFPRRVRAIRSF